MNDIIKDAFDNIPLKNKMRVVLEGMREDITRLRDAGIDNDDITTLDRSIAILTRLNEEGK